MTWERQINLNVLIVFVYINDDERIFLYLNIYFLNYTSFNYIIPIFILLLSLIKLSIVQKEIQE